MENKALHTTTAIVHCFGFSAENPRTFTILVSKSENPRGFSRNKTIAQPLLAPI